MTLILRCATISSMASPSILWETLRGRATLDNYRPLPPILLSSQACVAITRQITERINYAAKRAVKQAQQSVELFKGASIYRDLKDPAYRQAAAVSELFRGQLAHNGGYLDASRLQLYIAEANAGGRGIVYELGWGQAKRDAGRLKTAGTGADLAELVALGRLAMMVLATRLPRRPGYVAYHLWRSPLLRSIIRSAGAGRCL